MARTINEIADGIKSAFIMNAEIRNMYSLEHDFLNIAQRLDPVVFYNEHFSLVSIETIFIYLIAAVAHTIEVLFDKHKIEITHIVETERFGLPGWYQKMALQFRYGAGLDESYYDPDGDFADTDIYPEEYQDDSDYERIVKYAYAEEIAEHTGVTIKIAKEVDGELCPLDNGDDDTDDELSAFEAYMNRIKPAGIPITVVNRQPDNLSLELNIQYDALILNSNGELLSDTSVKPVETAIRQYLNSIEFNGRFVPMKLIDAVQIAEGVVVAEIVSATGQYGGHAAEPIVLQYTPKAGYMKLENNNLTINYIAYV